MHCGVWVVEGGGYLGTPYVGRRTFCLVYLAFCLSVRLYCTSRQYMNDVMTCAVRASACGCVRKRPVVPCVCVPASTVVRLYLWFRFRVMTHVCRASRVSIWPTQGEEGDCTCVALVGLPHA
jgi:hypothetical protein